MKRYSYLLIDFRISMMKQLIRQVPNVIWSQIRDEIRDQLIQQLETGLIDEVRSGLRGIYD